MPTLVPKERVLEILAEIDEVAGDTIKKIAASMELFGEEEDITRIKDALLTAFIQRTPGSKAWGLYRRGIICPTEAANCMLDEIENGLGPRVFFGAETPTVIDDRSIVPPRSQRSEP